MRSFLILFFGSLCLFAAAVAALNYFVDPSGIFRNSSGGPEIQLAKILADKSNALVGSNFDERIFQIFRTQVEKEFPPVIITGSSRTMPLGSRVLGVQSLNMSVSAASLEDHVALAVAAKKMHGPKVFLLGVDPWVFNENLGPTGWRIIRDQYDAASSTVGITGIPRNGGWDNKFLQLINYDYTKASLNLLFHPTKNARTVSASKGDSPEVDRALIRFDGSRVNSLRVSQIPQEQVDRLAKAYAKPPVYNLNNFKLSAKLETDFLKLVDYLKMDSRVAFVLPPYHPISYPLISKAYPEISHIEETLRREAANRGIPVIGSYDPSKLGCVDSDFSDGMHPTANCWEKIFSGPGWRKFLDGASGNGIFQDQTKTHVQ